jgi:hypothetical protein
MWDAIKTMDFSSLPAVIPNDDGTASKGNTSCEIILTLFRYGNNHHHHYHHHYY